LRGGNHGVERESFFGLGLELGQPEFLPDVIAAGYQVIAGMRVDDKAAFGGNVRFNG
jgi:hypothetical protein